MSDVQDIVDRFAENCDAGGVVYPSVVAEKTGLSFLDVYHCLSNRNDFYEMLEPYCDSCGRFSGIWFNAFWEIRGEFVCPHCGKTIDNAAGDAVIVFRKNRQS